MLKEAVEKIRDKPTDDSPVYTFLKGLRPPSLEKVMEAAAAAKRAPAPLGSRGPVRKLWCVDAAGGRGAKEK